MNMIPDRRTPEQQLAEIRAKRAEYARRWRANNPDKEAAIKRRYWARKLAESQQPTGGQAESD